MVKFSRRKKNNKFGKHDILGTYVSIYPSSGIQFWHAVVKPMLYFICQISPTAVHRIATDGHKTNLVNQI